MSTANTNKSVWSATSRGDLCDSLFTSRAAGHQSDNGWRAVAWTAASEALSGSEESDGGARKTPAACQSQFNSLKKSYKEICTLKGLSGAGWDEDKHVVVLPDAVAAAYFDKHPKLRKWLTTSFPHFDDIADLVWDTIATGANAFNPQAAPPPAGADPDDHEEDTHEPQGSQDSQLSAKPSIISVDDSDDDDERESTPSPAPRAAGKRRARSPSPARPIKKRRATAADALYEFSGAFRDFTMAMSDNPKIKPDAPIESDTSRRGLVIKMVQKAQDFSPHSQMRIIRHISRPEHTYVADCYLVLEPALRAAYLEAELNEIDRSEV